MPYVTRDPEGRVVALHANRNGDAKEELAADDPDLLSFVGRHVRLADIRDELEATDLELIRVIEDLITVLINNGILKLTDLPTGRGGRGPATLIGGIRVACAPRPPPHARG
jgi:hypothetical protein